MAQLVLFTTQLHTEVNVDVQLVLNTVQLQTEVNYDVYFDQSESRNVKKQKKNHEERKMK